MKEMEDLRERKDEVQAPKRSRRTPRGLSACVRRIHSALDEDAQYDGTQRVGSEHNKVVTQKIVKDIITSGVFTNRRDVEYAAKRYHEYLVRLEKTELPEAKDARLKAARIKQRRIRLYERRCMQARGKEVDIMQQLNEKAMTDEETDTESGAGVLVRRTPLWRSNKLTKLIKTLDTRKASKADTIPKKDRKTGSPSDRSPPKDLPKWALSTSSSEPSLCSLSDAPSPTSAPESPLQNQGLTPPSNFSSGLGLTPPSSSQGLTSRSFCLGLTPPSTRSSSLGLTPPSTRSSSSGLTPPSRFSNQGLTPLSPQSTIQGRSLGSPSTLSYTSRIAIEESSTPSSAPASPVLSEDPSQMVMMKPQRGYGQ